MKPAAFDYVRAADAEEAVQALAHGGDGARILAGGQSLMAMLNMRLASPSLLVDISRSETLARIEREGDSLRIGAAVTQGALEWRPGLRQELPLVALALPCISHFQVRNRGTVCGSIAHADPAAELPLCLLALQGEVLIVGTQGRRRVAADDFFTGMLSTALQAGDVIEAVRLPRAQAGQGFGFVESARRHGDFALCAVAVVAHAGGLRVAVGGVADRPMAQDWPVLEGPELDDALNDLAWALGPRDDPHADAATRRHLVRRLGRKAVAQARASRRPNA